VSPFRSFLFPQAPCAFAVHRFFNPLFSWSYELLFPQLLYFHNHLRCPGVWGSAPSALKTLRPSNVPTLCLQTLATSLSSRKKRIPCQSGKSTRSCQNTRSGCPQGNYRNATNCSKPSSWVSNKRIAEASSPAPFAMQLAARRRAPGGLVRWSVHPAVCSNRCPSPLLPE
jgi:hypothetical protein